MGNTGQPARRRPEAALLARRVGGPTVLAVILCAALGGCGSFTDYLTAQKARVSVTAAGKLILSEPPNRSGETIITAENISVSHQRLYLARLDAGVTALPVVDSVVPVGHDFDLAYQGSGYVVLTKFDELKGYFAVGGPVTTKAHVYLQPGRYVIFSNNPGDYAQSRWVDFSIPGSS